MTIELWSQMSSAYLAGELDRAETLGRELILQEPRHVRGLHCLSVIANRKQQKDVELALLRQVLEIDPGHVQALVGVANIIRARGNTDLAVDLCLSAIQRMPSYANAHNSLGLCRMTQKRPVEAAKCFRLALEYQPDLAAAQQNLNAALRQLKDPRRALAPCAPGDFENLGWLMVYRRQRSEAIEAFKRGLQLDENSVRLQQALADQLRQSGDAQESIVMWERLINLDPHSAHHHCARGYALQDLGRFVEALEAFDRSLALNPEQGDAYLGKVTCRKIVREDEAMIEQMQALSSRLSASERFYILSALSKCKDDLGEYEAAVRCMDAANIVGQMEAGLSPGFARQWFSKRFEANQKTFSREFFLSPPPPVAPTPRPVFLVGLPRSGTTLMEQMLAGHPEIAAAGELTFWGDEESILDGGLSKTIHNRALSEKVINRYLDILKGVDSQAQRVVDKMPDNFAHIGFIHALLPNARFIHCRRNALDNCVSIYMTPFRNRPPMAYQRADILFYFRRYEELMGHWQQVIPEENLFDLSYEDLVANPETVMRGVIDFLGLEWNEGCLNHQNRNRSVNTPSNWQTRQPIYSTSVNRWRRYEPWLGELSELQ